MSPAAPSSLSQVPNLDLITGRRPVFREEDWIGQRKNVEDVPYFVLEAAKRIEEPPLIALATLPSESLSISETSDK